MAIQFALSSDQLEIIGLTTVFGNVPVELATSNALLLLHLAGKDAVPVAQGASKPLKGEFADGAPEVHGKDGLGNSFPPPSPLSPVSQSACQFIIEQVETHPQEITLVAVGPLTNLAEVLSTYPEVVGLVKEVVIMGGNALCPGNITPAAEANIYSDPEAADIVLGAGWPLTMVGLDVTHKVHMGTGTLHAISKIQNPLNQLVSKAMVFYEQFYTKYTKTNGIFVHDSTAIAYVLAPHLFKTSAGPVRVDSTEGTGRGKTWPCLEDASQEDNLWLLPWKNRPKINICVDVDGEAVIKLITDNLIRFNR
jgi:inosine-uridine nucleoside N-ribohydrolase